MKAIWACAHRPGKSSSFFFWLPLTKHTRLEAFAQMLTIYFIFIINKFVLFLCRCCIEWQWSRKSSAINGMIDRYLNFIATNEIITSIYRKVYTYMKKKIHLNMPKICNKNQLHLIYVWCEHFIRPSWWLLTIQAGIVIVTFTMIPTDVLLIGKSVNAIDFYLYIVNSSPKIQQ